MDISEHKAKYNSSEMSLSTPRSEPVNDSVMKNISGAVTEYCYQTVACSTNSMSVQKVLSCKNTLFTQSCSLRPTIVDHPGKSKCSRSSQNE